MIHIEGLSKSYRDGDQRVSVLNSLSLELPDAAFVALLGRSGSGKSTLLNCIAGLEKPNAGRILIGDVDITALNERDRTIYRRDHIGIIFQFFQLLPTLSVLENVSLPGRLAGLSNGEVRSRATELLDHLDMADRRDDLPEHLSGGEQQRVATARALINKPKLLLADEPTGNLDSNSAERTLELLARVNEDFGVSILMATHSAEAAKIAAGTAKIDAGTVTLSVPKNA